MPALSLMCVVSSKIAGEAGEADLSATDPNSTWEDDGLSSVDVVIFTVSFQTFLPAPHEVSCIP